MEKNIIVIGLIALLIGAGGGYALGMNNVPQPVGGHMMTDDSVMEGDEMGMEDEMDSMMAGLEGKTGDAFDREFLSEMIVHHQGAVAMAEAALKDAKHQEIKDLAKNIISAQNTEIKQMQDWKSTWYGQ